MQALNTYSELRDEVTDILEKQGYKVETNGTFYLKRKDRESMKRAHFLAKAEKISAHEDFILGKAKLVEPYLLDGIRIEIDKIKPKIIEIMPGTFEESLFNWWNLTWWSLPYERGYGRQMRFIVWDEYHNAPMGLISLQSPILSWSVRDSYLGISKDERDFWVNQSLNAQRLGALPPYNYLLGGKLMALLLTSDVIRNRFQKKYKGKKTSLMNRNLPARLLFVTTTGAYGKSSVYQRLKFKEEDVVQLIGFSQGAGTFHIPQYLYENLLQVLQENGEPVKRGYGNGPSRKLRLLDKSLHLLGFTSGAVHGVKRAVYLFPLAKNLEAVIKDNKRPLWVHRKVDELVNFWKDRWAIPRAERDKSYLDFTGAGFLEQIKKDLKKYKRVCPIEEK